MVKAMTTYKNPIVIERADPWVYKHTDGYYYFTGSVPGYQEIEVRRAKSLNELENGERAGNPSDPRALVHLFRRGGNG